MFQKTKLLLAMIFLIGSVTQPLMANSLTSEDMSFVFNTTETSNNFDGISLLSDQDMAETEGEWWPVIYGAAWVGARATIWAAGRYGSRWGYRAVRSSNNHRLLLRNGNHVLQTGGRRGVSGYGQQASHIGWGRSSRGNFSNRHMFYNSRWRIR